jgi:hypothetical protein
MMYDAVAAYPVNFVTSFTWLHLYVLAAAAIVWAFSRMGMFSEASFIPYPLILMWVIACLGRVSRLIIHRGVPYSLQIPIYLATVFAVANVWGHAESLLKSCGAKPGELPSFGTLITGLLGLPIADFIAA